MLKFLNALSEDFMETLTRPDTTWQIVDITNITFYVTKLQDVALGAPIDLPDNVKFNSGLINFSLKIIFRFFDVWPSLRELFLRGVTPDAVKLLQNVYLMISVSISKFFSKISKESIFLTFQN